MPQNQQKEMTFEELDKHFSNADLSQFKMGAKGPDAAAAKANPAEVLAKICAIYKVVSPLLAVVSNLPFFPKKWKEPLQTFITLMNNVCPAQP